MAELGSQTLLDGWRHLFVGNSVEAGGRNLRGEPVCLGKFDCNGNEVFFDLCRRQLLTDLIQGLNCLYMRSVLGLCHKNDDQTLSRTSGSSIAAKFSSGDNSTCPYSGPPTYSTKLPNSSLRAVRTSSSSSTESASLLLGLSCSAAVGHESTYHQGMESIHLLYALDRGQAQSSTGGELR